jgi:hypothetical protein
MRLPKWERLSEALQRVTGTGVTEKKAKRDICEAIADRKIRPRLYFTWRPTSETFLTRRGQPTSKVHYLTDEEIPSELRLGDFNWRRSRIRKSGVWQNARGPSGSFFGNWRVVEIAHYRQADSIPDSQRGGRALAYEHRVELRSTDVTKVFNMGKERAPAATQPKSAAGAKWQGVQKALLALYPPHGIPPPELTAKERNRNVAKWLAANGYSTPNSDAALARLIQRVLKTLRSKTPRTPRQ